jgi:hypothetical protein
VIRSERLADRPGVLLGERIGEGSADRPVLLAVEQGAGLVELLGSLRIGRGVSSRSGGEEPYREETNEQQTGHGANPRQKNDTGTQAR